MDFVVSPTRSCSSLHSNTRMFEKLWARRGSAIKWKLLLIGTTAPMETSESWLLSMTSGGARSCHSRGTSSWHQTGLSWGVTGYPEPMAIVMLIARYQQRLFARPAR